MIVHAGPGVFPLLGQFTGPPPSEVHDCNLAVEFFNDLSLQRDLQRGLALQDQFGFLFGTIVIGQPPPHPMHGRLAPGPAEAVLIVIRK